MNLGSSQTPFLGTFRKVIPQIPRYLGSSQALWRNSPNSHAEENYQKLKNISTSGSDSLGKFLEKRNLDLGTSQISRNLGKSFRKFLKKRKLGIFPKKFGNFPDVWELPWEMSQEKEYGNFPNSLWKSEGVYLKNLEISLHRGIWGTFLENLATAQMFRNLGNFPRKVTCELQSSFGNLRGAYF